MKTIWKILCAVLVLGLIAGCAIAETQDAALVVTALSGMEDAQAELKLAQHFNGDIGITVSIPLSETETKIWEVYVPVDRIDVDQEEICIAYTDAIARVETVLDGGVVAFEYVSEAGSGELTATDDGFRWTNDIDSLDMEFINTNDLLVRTNYQDSVSQRASMTISGLLSMDDTEWVFDIDWANSADETLHWTMSAVVPGVIEGYSYTFDYDNCVCTRVTYEEGVARSETVYEGGTGSFEYNIGEDDKTTYKWLPDNENFAENCVFEALYLD